MGPPPVIRPIRHISPSKFCLATLPFPAPPAVLMPCFVKGNTTLSLNFRCYPRWSLSCSLPFLSCTFGPANLAHQCFINVCYWLLFHAKCLSSLYLYCSVSKELVFQSKEYEGTEAEENFFCLFVWWW